MLSHAPLILASASPRRLDLLKRIGITPAHVVPADIDETPRKGELPRDMALRLAREKALAIPAADYPAHYIVAADSVVGVGRRILPKSENDADEALCLDLLSGRSHHVYTGMAVLAPTGKCVSRVVSTRVTFKKLTPAEKAAYIASGEGIGKAGGYGIQGLAETFVTGTSGASFSCVVGLSLYDIRSMLEGVGFYTANTES